MGERAIETLEAVTPWFLIFAAVVAVSGTSVMAFALWQAARHL